jgi:hypothetical protein
MEARTGGRGSTCPDQAVPRALEPGRVVALRRYSPHYHLPLESMGDSALSTFDLSI